MINRRMRMAPSGTYGWRRWIPSASFACARPLAPLLLCAAVLAPATGARAEAEEAPPLTASIGYSFWHGDFGAPTKTLISSTLVGVRYHTGGLRLSASLPYMRIRSDGSFFAGLGGTPLFVAPNVLAQKRIRKGLGDLTLGAAYLLPGGEQRGFDLEFTGRAKVPTATDRSQLSTGKADYAGGVEVSKAVGRLIPSASVTMLRQSYIP